MKRILLFLTAAFCAFAAPPDKAYNLQNYDSGTGRFVPYQPGPTGNEGKVPGFSSGLPAMLPVNFFNVTRYGAIPDDTVDDRAGIQAAIDLAKAAGGGTVYIPEGSYRLFGPLNLTGSTLGQIKIVGDGKYVTALTSFFASGTIIDMTGSHLCELSNFRISSGGGLLPNQAILCARLAGNASSGNHTFRDLFIQGSFNNAGVILWGSETNQWSSCLFFALNDAPVIASAVNMPLAGYPSITSTFVTVGDGSGGNGLNTFYGCSFHNDTNLTQTKSLVRLFGTNAWLFSNCFSHSSGPATYEINGSPYPAGPTSVYYSRVTFDTCEDESIYAANTKRSIYFSEFPVSEVGSLKESARGVHVKNCAFLKIYADDNTLVDNFVFEGGRHSPSIPTPAGFDKISLYQATNSLISPSKHEKSLTYVIRNSGSSIGFRGTAAGVVTTTGVTGLSILNDAGVWESKLENVLTTEQLKIGYDNSNYFTGTVGSTGAVTFNALGAGQSFVFQDAVLAASGTLVAGGTAVASPTVSIQGTAATNRSLSWLTGNTTRWRVRTDNTAEAGADAGSNFSFDAFTDAGAAIDTPFFITRAAGGSIRFDRPLLHRFDGSNYVTQTVSSAGIVTNDAVGSTPAFFFSDGVYSTSGTLISGGTAVSNPSVSIQGAAATNRTLSFLSGNNTRWTVRAASNAEGGSDTGSPYEIKAYTDAGALIDAPLTITRAAGGAATFTRPIVTSSSISSTAGATTLAAAATTMAVTGNVVTVTGDAGANTLATITGGVSGQVLTLTFVDSLVTITDTAAATANTVNLSAAFTSTANDTLTLVFVSGKWLEVARSIN